MLTCLRLASLSLALLPLASTFAHANPIAAGFDSTSLGRTDDGSSRRTNLGFSIDFFGSTYSSVYVNNNGNITFSSPNGTFTPSGLASSTQAIIAPFYADVDTRGTGSGVAAYGTGTYNGNLAWGATWSGVGYYNEATDKLNSFQVILVNRSDLGAGDFDIYFNYGNMLWESGSASNGVHGLGGSCAFAGYSNGTVAEADQVTYQQAGSGSCGALINGGSNSLAGHSNDGVTGQYLFTDRSGVLTSEATNAPVPEPSTLALLGTGVVGLATRLRSRLR